MANVKDMLGDLDAYQRMILLHIIKKKVMRIYRVLQEDTNDKTRSRE
jgi:hypothetical protein